MRPLVLGVDIGGTKVALGVGRGGGAPLASARHPAEVDRGPAAMIERIVAEARALLDGRAPARIGVACGGPLDRAAGLVCSPPNLPGWDRVPLCRALEQALGAPALLDNDANLAALAEQRFGAARGHGDVLYVTISTGIGGGVLRGGRLVHGVGDAAGELGHQTLEADGPACGCGGRGCLEALASGTAIARAARTLARADRGRGAALVAAAGGDLAAITATTVAECAAAGDALAGEVWARAVGWLALGVGNAITILAPEIVVLGGGVASAGAALLEPVRAIVAERVRLVPRGSYTIELAALGSDSSLWGALALAADAAAA